MAVAVVPPPLMLVLDALPRRSPLEHVREVLGKSRLEFYRGDRSGRAHHEDRRDPVGKPGTGGRLLDMAGDVEHFVPAFATDLEASGLYSDCHGVLAVCGGRYFSRLPE